MTCVCKHLAVGRHVPVDMTPPGPAPVCKASKTYHGTVAVKTARTTSTLKGKQTAVIT